MPREDRGRVLLHGLVHVADVRENVVADLHERRRGVRSALRNRCDARDRLTEIPDHRIARLFRRGIAELRGLQLAVQHMHRTHSGIPLRPRCIDVENPRVRNGADDPPGVQHSRELDVEGVSRSARHFLDGVEPGQTLPDHVQRRVLGERGRLVYRHAPRHPADAVPNDLTRARRFQPQRLRLRSTGAPHSDAG